MYDGAERRKTLDRELQDFKLEVTKFTSTVEEWMKTTTEYRHSLCDKIDLISNKLNELPCRERKQWYQSIEKRIKWLWIIISGVILAIVKEWSQK